MPSSVGVIETIRVRGGAIPLLERHLTRLTRSLAALGLAAPERDPAALVRPFASMDEAVVRVEVSDGRVAVTVREVPSAAPPVVIVARARHRPYPHKTTARDVFDAAVEEARSGGADDALLLDARGSVAEGTVGNVFWWEGDRLRTPSLGLGILPGIGRARVLELAPVEEGEFSLGDVQGRSLFLVNAVRGIVSVAALSDVTVPVEARTAELSRRFWPD